MFKQCIYCTLGTALYDKKLSNEEKFKVIAVKNNHQSKKKFLCTKVKLKLLESVTSLI